jgi:hypothetical protein
VWLPFFIRVWNVCNTINHLVLRKIGVTKNVRFDPALEASLEQAARALGVSQSELIRDAVAKRSEEVWQPSLAERLGPVSGRIKTSGGRARDTGKAFRRLWPEV